MFCRDKGERGWFVRIVRYSHSHSHSLTFTLFDLYPLNSVNKFDWKKLMEVNVGNQKKRKNRIEINQSLRYSRFVSAFHICRIRIQCLKFCDNIIRIGWWVVWSLNKSLKFLILAPDTTNWYESIEHITQLLISSYMTNAFSTQQFTIMIKY